MSSSFLLKDHLVEHWSFGASQRDVILVSQPTGLLITEKGKDQ